MYKVSQQLGLLFLFLFSVLNLVIASGNSSELHISPKASATRLTVNMGNTPWHFYKVVSQNQLNLALNKPLAISVINEDTAVTVDLDTIATLESLRVEFSNTNILSVNYVIEASNDQNTWISLVNKPSKYDPAYTKARKTTTVAETGNTVGFVEKENGAYLDAFLNGKYRFIRFRIIRVLDKQGVSVEPKDIKLIVRGAKNSADKENDFINSAFNDKNWEQVGIPHCYNDNDTYLNDSETHMWRGTAWYRKTFTVDKKLKGKKIFIEFKGINVGAAVYVNGKLKHGNTVVKQPVDVTHVGGFLPFTLDITDDINFGGNNLVSVKVSNGENSFFTWPGFGVYEGFGMAWGGIVCPVYLHVTNNLHIPSNAYSPLNKWGTYAATTSATKSLAKLTVQTNVENENAFACNVTVVNKLIDKGNKVVLTMRTNKRVEANSTALFSHLGEIVQPQLWYPNNSPFGKPYLYTIVTEIFENDKIVDTYESKTGLRVITWDDDYCYVNGEKHILRGFGHRNIYPALGSAIPPELQWKDIQLIADAGGNTLRVGHVPTTEVMLAACDEYGIMVMQISGDNEWSLKNEPANTYKREYDRDMMIAFRNHPSITVWESNNGLAGEIEQDLYWPSYTQEIADKWDSLQPRLISSRDRFPEHWDKANRIMVGYTNSYKKVEGSPSINLEVYGASWDGGRSHNIDRFDYANEKQFVNWFINDYNSNIKNKACGWIDWMLAETQGEGYTTYLNGRKRQKSLGSSAMDGNRIPKLKYNIYKNALWVDFNTKPGVALQSDWSVDTIQDVDAWSNCPQVALYLNDKLMGIKTPDSLSKRCTWEKIAWQQGTLKAVGLDNNGKEVCADKRVSVGLPHHIVLSVEPNLVKPDGIPFKITANGSDVAIITAKIVDKDGNLCTNADNNIDFDISGNGIYRGSYNFYVVDQKPLNYHAPGDKQLQAEGGLMRIAVRSTFVAGNVMITAKSGNLVAGAVSFKTKL